VKVNIRRHVVGLVKQDTKLERKKELIVTWGREVFGEGGPRTWAETVQRTFDPGATNRLDRLYRQTHDESGRVKEEKKQI